MASGWEAAWHHGRRAARGLQDDTAAMLGVEMA